MGLDEEKHFDKMNLERFKQWEIVPHTEPVSIGPVNFQNTTYTTGIKLPPRFLLRRILTRQMVHTIRLKFEGREMYYGPGWLHYQYESAVIKPELLMNGGYWIVEITIETWNDIEKRIELAFIGERAVELCMY